MIRSPLVKMKPLRADGKAQPTISNLVKLVLPNNPSLRVTSFCRGFSATNYLTTSVRSPQPRPTIRPRFSPIRCLARMSTALDLKQRVLTSPHYIRQFSRLPPCFQGTKTQNGNRYRVLLTGLFFPPLQLKWTLTTSTTLPNSSLTRHPCLTMWKMMTISFTMLPAIPMVAKIAPKNLMALTRSPNTSLPFVEGPAKLVSLVTRGMSMLLQMLSTQDFPVSGLSTIHTDSI